MARRRAVRWAGGLLAASLLAVSAPVVIARPSRSEATGPTFRLPLAGRLSWSTSHHDYPAADMFPRTGCGTTVMAPTSGTIIQTRPVNRYPGSHDNPAWRGGITVDMLGDDGVRFHLAHLSSIHAGIVSGVRVDVGQALGTVGRTGRASVCHLHLGISPPCPKLEWSVRRGVVWPQRYLTAWKHGIALDPATEVNKWVARHRSACTAAEAQAHAADS